MSMENLRDVILSDEYLDFILPYYDGIEQDFSEYGIQFFNSHLVMIHSRRPQLQPAASPPVWATSQLLFPPAFPVSAAALPFLRQHPQHLALSVRIPPFLVNLLSS